MLATKIKMSYRYILIITQIRNVLDNYIDIGIIIINDANAMASL